MIVSFIRFFSVAQHWIRLVYSSTCHEFLVTIFAGQKYRLCITMLNISHVVAFLIYTRVSLKNVLLLTLSDQRFSDFFMSKVLLQDSNGIPH